MGASADRVHNVEDLLIQLADVVTRLEAMRTLLDSNRESGTDDVQIAEELNKLIWEKIRIEDLLQFSDRQKPI
jgi:hypothetical protein